VFLNPRPADNELPTIYPEHYIPYRFDEHLSPLMQKARMWLQRRKAKDLLKLAGPGAAVWDVGCGGGFLLQLLQRFGRPTWKLAGVDICPRSVQKVRQLGIEALCGRFETLDVPRNSVDVIVLNQVLEHLDDPAAVVAKAFSVLSPGGYLFVEVPSLEGWDAKLFGKRHWGGWHFPRHWTFYTRQSLTAVLTQNGFAIHEHRWLLSPNFWAQSLHHWLIDRGVPQRAAGWVDCSNPLVMALFTAVDLLQKQFGHTSNMRIVGRKPSAAAGRKAA